MALDSPLLRAFLSAPMVSLKAALEGLAAGFAVDLVRAIQGASIVELQREVRGTAKRERPSAESFSSRTGGRRSKGARLRRRTSDDIAGALDRIVGALRAQQRGLRAEQIRSMLHMEAKELPRVLAEGLAEGKLRKEGQKRATTYFAM